MTDPCEFEEDDEDFDPEDDFGDDPDPSGLSMIRKSVGPMDRIYEEARNVEFED